MNPKEQLKPAQYPMVSHGSAGASPSQDTSRVTFTINFAGNEQLLDALKG